MVPKDERGRSRTAHRASPAGEGTSVDAEDPEDVYRAITQFAPWGLHFYEKRGDDLILIGCNPACNRLLGIDCSPLIGRSIEDAFPSEDIAEIKANYMRVIETGSPWSNEDMVYRDDNIDGVFEVHAFRLTGRSMAASFMDITDRKRSEAAMLASEERLRSLHDTMLQGVIYQDRDGRVSSINPAAMRILGKNEAELMEATSEDLENPPLRSDGTEFPRAEQPSIVALATGRPQQDVVMGVYNPRKCEYRWISIYAHPIFRPKESMPYRVYTIFSDITEYRKVRIEREEERKRLQLILDSMPVAIGIADAEGRLLQVNRLAREIWRGEIRLVDSIQGYSEFRGFWPGTGREIAPQEWPLARAIREKREMLDQVLEIQRFDGTKGTILCSCVPMVDDKGSITGGLAAYMEITRQKEAEMELSATKMQLETIIDSVPVGVRIADVKGRHINMNRTLRRIWHEDVPRTEELVDVDRQEAWWVDSDISVQQRDWPLHETLNTGRPAAARTFDIRRLDGSRGTIMASAAPLFDEGGLLVGGMAFTQDITEIKANERDLKRSNTELQHFAYIASHDLQEPLRMVVGFLSLLEKKYGQELDGREREYIAYAVEGGERMRALINDLLAYSRIDSRREPFHSVDMNDVVRQTLDLLQVSIQESGASIMVEELPVIAADEPQMRQVLQNLVGNSLKFRGAQAPHILISAKEAAHEWIFSVQDNGIGIDPEYSEKIFMMFQRLHDRTEYPGTGVGLAIAKKIVERHGGRIWVSSLPGEGATFYFSLPKMGVR